MLPASAYGELIQLADVAALQGKWAVKIPHPPMQQIEMVTGKLREVLNALGMPAACLIDVFGDQFTTRQAIGNPQFPVLFCPECLQGLDVGVCHRARQAHLPGCVVVDPDVSLICNPWRGGRTEGTIKQPVGEIDVIQCKPAFAWCYRTPAMVNVGVFLMLTLRTMQFYEELVFAERKLLLGEVESAAVIDGRKSNKKPIPE